jgi:D-serine deaminase-like pyridoxal phosphate-dependent protein
MRLDDLPTPSLILDRTRLARNVERMQARARELGVTLRPHLKTAKSARVAELASGNSKGGKGPITVSTLAEATYFAKHRFQDITYAVPIVPAKLDTVARLMAEGVDLKLITDNETVARTIAGRGKALGVSFRVLVKIDCGLGRAGIAPESEALLPIAAALNQPGASLAGVLTHAGHSYNAHSIEEIKAIAEEERLAVVKAAERLRRTGHPCEIVSVGSTPTAIHAERLEGVTEMRPGNFAFFDLFQLGIESCTVEDIAVSVLASVDGHHRERNHLLIDAGGLALSKDTGANKNQPGTGYGLVCLPGGKVPLPGLAVLDVHQEHGLIGHAKGLDAMNKLPFERFPIGSRLRVLPNHVCMTAAAYDRYYVTDGGTEIVDEWDRVNGW